MDVLIKNMKMPKEGNVYLIIGEDGVVSEKIGSMYHVTTEAIELPPHGDLIDKEELIRKLRTYNWVRCGTDVMTVIENAIVVLEASNGSDN